MATLYSETSRAFDAHARHYDALVEPNALLHHMRVALWREVMHRVPPPAHLLDIGSGTGIDAAYFAQNGYQLTAIDTSPEMIRQTRARLSSVISSKVPGEPTGPDEKSRARVGSVRVLEIGAQELDKLGNVSFDAIYSDLGPLNCVPDLRVVSQQCAAHIKPSGLLILSLMARICPWEIGYFTLRGEFNNAVRRHPKAMVPVNLENGVVWTRYYSPKEFFEYFANEFRLITYRALNLVLPPPYLLRWYNRVGALAKPMAWLDEKVSTLPILHNMGDHFLIVLQKQ